MKEFDKINSLLDEIKNRVNKVILNAKIDQEYKKNNTKFTLYKKESILPITLYGCIDKDIITVYGDIKIEPYSVIVNECNKQSFRVLETRNTEINTKYDNTIYIRKGIIIHTDKNLKEVKVIKVKNKYYLYNE